MEFASALSYSIDIRSFSLISIHPNLLYTHQSYFYIEGFRFIWANIFLEYSVYIPPFKLIISLSCPIKYVKTV